MSKRPTRLVLILGSFALLVLFSLRNYLGLLLVGGVGLVILSLLLIAIITLGRVAFNTFLTHQRPPARPTDQPPSPSFAPTSTPFIQRLQTAFRRNHPADIDRALSLLPPWPITIQLQTTAQALFALKRSVYRAQTEGVPALLIQRYLANIEQASEIMWQLASKVDALGQQKIGYEIVAPRLEQEAMQLQQVQQSAAIAQESIALLIVSGIQSSELQTIDEDLSALTVAVKQLTAATNTFRQPVAFKQ